MKMNINQKTKIGKIKKQKTHLFNTCKEENKYLTMRKDLVMNWVNFIR